MHYKGVHPRNWTYTQQKRPYLEGSTGIHFSKAPPSTFGMRYPKPGKPLEISWKPWEQPGTKRTPYVHVQRLWLHTLPSQVWGGRGHSNLLASAASGADIFLFASFTWGSWWQLKYFFNVHPELWGRWTHLDSYLLDWVGKHQLVNIEAISRLCEARDEHSWAAWTTIFPILNDEQI